MPADNSSQIDLRSDVRVIICGPRDCPHEATADRLVVSLKRKHGDSLTIVVGGCLTGTDEHVRLACVRYAIRHEVNPADWDRYDNQAGPIRNKSMALRGASACFAVVIGERQPVRGTGNMARASISAGIRCFRVTTASDGHWTIHDLNEVPRG